MTNKEKIYLIEKKCKSLLAELQVHIDRSDQRSYSPAFRVFKALLETNIVMCGKFLKQKKSSSEEEMILLRAFPDEIL